MRFIEAKVLVLAFSALFYFAGYLVGRMAKKTMVVIVLLVLLCSIPSVLVFGTGAFRSSPLPPARLATIQQTMVVWDASTTLLILAGYVLSRRRSLGMAVACVLFLMQVTDSGMQWFNQTRWLDSVRWHQTYRDRVRIGSWEFVIPEAWYGKQVSGAVVEMWRALGVSEHISLERRSLSLERERSTIEIFTPIRTVASSAEEANNLMLDAHFQIQGEYGMCSVIRHENNELRFMERCIFPKANLRVDIEARSEEELHEAGRILSGGQFVKTSNPYAAHLLLAKRPLFWLDSPRPAYRHFQKGASAGFPALFGSLPRAQDP